MWRRRDRYDHQQLRWALSLMLSPLMTNVVSGAAGRGTLTIHSRGGDVWGHRVLVAGTAAGADWTALSLVAGDRRLDFSPRNGFFELAMPLVDGENLVRAVGRTADGAVFESAPVRFFVPLGRYAPGADLPDAAEERPDGPARQAVVYGTCVHLHSDRGLAGIIADLDRLASLGCNAIWLNPTFPSGGRGRFGYDVTDYFGVRDSYGTLAGMRELTRQAHARGLRVLLDLVANHTSERHPYFQDALAHGEFSRYHEFYAWEAGGTPRHYFGWTHLPNLNYEHAEVRRMMLEVGRFWIGKIGIDGFRIDVAWGVDERRPGYWREWVAEMRRLYPAALFIAEASARWPSLFEQGFDAAYDWDDGFQPAWRDVFASESQAADRLDQALRGGWRGFSPDAVAFRFVDNNDTGTRFHTRYGGDRARLACLLLTTLPGIPLVYLGQENGAHYEPYNTLEPVVPGHDDELADLYRRMLALRAREPALTSPDWERLPVAGSRSAYAYCRRAPGARSAAVVLNLGRPGGEFILELPGGIKDCQVTDVAFGRPGRIAGGRLRVELGAYGGAVFLLPQEIAPCSPSAAGERRQTPG